MRTEVVSAGGAVTGELVFGRLGVAAVDTALVTALVLLALLAEVPASASNLGSSGAADAQ